MTRLAAVASILLVLCLVAFWWAGTGSTRAVTPPQRSPEADASPAREPDAAPEPAGRSLLVMVRDAESGAPLPGSTVVAKPWNGGRVEAVTDEAGEARLAPVDGRVLAQHRGYAPKCERVGIATSGLILLLQPGIGVRGRVVRAGTESGIEGAKVTVTLVDSDDTFIELTTDQEGRFKVLGLPPDAPFLVVAEHPGIAPVGRVVRRAEADREIVLEMAGGAVVEGRVVRPDGTAAADAMVRVLPLGSDSLLPDELPCWVPGYVVETWTDAQGAFRVEGLRVPAVYEVTATDDRMTRGRGDDVALRNDGQVAWREIRLDAKTTLHLRVEFPPSTPSTYASAFVRQNGRSVGPQIGGGVGKEGYTWELKSTGLHEVGVVASNWPTTLASVDVREGVANEVVIRMTREGHRVVSGRVVDERGIPLHGVEIGAAFTAADSTLRTSPEADGTFHLCDVPDMVGTLEISDWTGVHLPWTRAGVAPGDDVEVILRVAARFVGRVDPPPASRRIPVHRLNRASWPPGTKSEEIGTWLVSTGAKGGFEIPWSPGKRIALAFDPPDAAPVFLDEPPLAEGEVRDLGVIRLVPGRSAEGVVLDDVGNPVADCRICLEILRGYKGPVILSGPSLDDRIAYTGPDGRFRATRLPDAPLEATLSAEGFIEQTVVFPTPVDLNGSEIRLVRAGTIEGVLLDADGRPAGAEDIECPATEGHTRFDATTDSVGRFRILAAPGAYRLMCDGHEGPVVEVRARETTRVEFRLKE